MYRAVKRTRPSLGVRGGPVSRRTPNQAKKGQNSWQGQADAVLRRWTRTGSAGSPAWAAGQRMPKVAPTNSPLQKLARPVARAVGPLAATVSTCPPSVEAAAKPRAQEEQPSLT